MQKIKPLSFLILTLCLSSACTRKSNLDGCWQHADYPERKIEVVGDTMFAYLAEYDRAPFVLRYSDTSCDGEQSSKSNQYFFVSSQPHVDGQEIREDCYELIKLSSSGFEFLDGSDTVRFVSINCDSLKVE